MRINSTLLFAINAVLAVSVNVVAFQTSSESVNPFNQFMSPYGGINMYSGDAAYSHPLVSLPGRNGMGIGISLNYSSNIYLNVRARNDKAPTHWLGLGWALGYGAIVCNHNGTRTHQDDQFFYISPQGVSSRILDGRGINYKYYTGSWTALPDFGTLTPDASGRVRNINLNQRGQNANIAFLFEGSIKVETQGNYTFYTESDDGSKLYIDGQLVVDNDGIHAMRERSGTVSGLTTGFHTLRVEYFDGGDVTGLKVNYEGPGFSKRGIPWQLLYPVGPNEEKRAFFIENDPYSRLDALTDANGVIKGWIVKTLDGKMLKYGNLDFTDERNATRYTFAWDLQVGAGWGGNPDLYPYQWDLSEMEDNFGNKVVFKYQQELEALVHGNWDTRNLSPAKYYTKASYLESISNPEGGHVVFELEDKPDVAVDPYRMKSEPDDYIELYESKRLHTIRVYRTADVAEDMISFQFGYSTINGSEPGLGADYRKGLLTSILEYQGSPSNALKETVFEYYTDFDQADPDNEDYDESYNYGALWKIKNGMGGTTEYVYKREQLNLVHTNFSIDPTWQPRGLYAGALSDGNAYMVSRGTTAKNHLTIYNWDGTRWAASNIVKEEFTVGDNEVDVYPSGDHIILREGADDYFQILSWDGTKWVTTLGKQKKKWGWQTTQPVPFGNHVAFVEGASDVLEILSWNGVDWDISFPQQKINTLGTPMEIVPSNNHLALHYGSPKDYMEIMTYNGSTWDTTFDQRKLAMPGNDFDLFPSGNHYALRHGADDYLQIISWDGHQWDTTLNRTKLGLPNYDVDVYPGPDRFALRHGADDILQVLSWDGEEWDTTFQRTNLKEGDANVDLYMGIDYIALRHGWRDNMLQVLGWNGVGWDTTFERTTIGISTDDFEVWPARDYMVFRHGADDYIEARSWDGSQWNVSFPKRKLKDGGGLEVAQAGNAFGVEGNVDSLWFFYKFQDGFDNPVYSYSVSERNIEDGINVTTSTFDFNADEKAHYDTRAGTAKMNKVEAFLPGNGKSVTYFFSDDPAEASVNADYAELDGLVYATATYNEANKTSESNAVTESDVGYELYAKPTWPSLIKQKRQVGSANKRDGVSAVNSTSYGACQTDTNGLARFSEAVGSEGEKLVSFTLFAHEVPSYASVLGIHGENLLSQPAMTLTLEDFDIQNACPANWYASIDKAYIRRASATTWSNHNTENGNWAPCSTYAWNVPMDGTGKPTVNFVAFNFANPASNATNGWKYMGAVTKYNSHGQVIEAEKPGGASKSYSATIYRPDVALAAAAAQQARCDEFAVYTCDYLYDIQSGCDLDEANGWWCGEKFNDNPSDPTMSRLQLSSDFLHFGQKSLWVKDSYGPSRNVKGISSAKDYVFSAWVYPNYGTNFIRMSVELRKDNGDGTSTNIGSYSKKLLVGVDYGQEKWNYVSHTVLADQLDEHLSSGYTVDDIDFYRIWIGNLPDEEPIGGTDFADFFVDDIRFYPSGALVGTTYYDGRLGKPICSVDANNQPGRRIAYDDFGRPVRWEKIDRTKSRGESGADVVVMEKEYHLKGN